MRSLVKLITQLIWFWRHQLHSAYFDLCIKFPVNGFFDFTWNCNIMYCLKICLYDSFNTWQGIGNCSAYLLEVHNPEAAISASCGLLYSLMRLLMMLSNHVWYIVWTSWTHMNATTIHACFTHTVSCSASAYAVYVRHVCGAEAERSHFAFTQDAFAVSCWSSDDCWPPQTQQLFIILNSNLYVVTENAVSALWSTLQ